MNKRILAGAVGLCAVTAGAQAVPMEIMQMQMFGPQAADWSTTLTFNQYAGPETVLSIQVIVDLEVTGGELVLDNDGVNATNVNADFGTSLAISSGDVALVNGALMPVVGAVEVLNNAVIALGGNDADPDNQFNDDGGLDNGSLLGVAGNDSGSGFVNAAAWAGYIGGGTFDIDLAADTAFDLNGASAVQLSLVNQVAKGKVTIIYTVTPAPGAVALLGLGGLCATRRRR